ncbi:RNA-directed DNA polymerase, eukaryota, reverse transcriptase zinc-binding domain protein [Tanacetum coccineum]
MGPFRLRTFDVYLMNIFFLIAVCLLGGFKFIPIKINVFAWRVYLDRLPTRLNLNRRNIQVLDQSCPVCKDAQKSFTLFFLVIWLVMFTDLYVMWNPDVVLSVMLLRGMGVPWFKDIRLGSILKCMLEGYLFFNSLLHSLILWVRPIYPVIFTSSYLKTEEFKVTPIEEIYKRLTNGVDVYSGPTLFKLYNSWLLRDGFDNLIKEEWELLDSNLKCHEKFCRLKDKIKQWSNNIKTLERNRKTVALEKINSIEKRIDEGSAMPSDNDHRLILFQEIEKIDKFVLMDIIQKAHVKWDIEGDENSKFFHGLINQKRRNQMINGIMVEGSWITNPCLIKDAFLQFYKRKFQAQDSQVMFSNLPHSHSLNCMDRETLERQVTLEEIKEAVWDCGSSKAPGPDGYSFAFVKKYWGTIQKDLYDFVNLFFASL